MHVQKLLGMLLLAVVSTVYGAEEPSLRGLAAEPHYPHSNIWVGISRERDARGLPVANFILPVTEAAAIAEGWTLEGTEYVSSVPSPFKLTFDEGNIISLQVKGKPSPFFASTAEDGYKVEFKTKDGKLEAKVNDIKLKSSSDKMEEASWFEGGCSSFMGGTHYGKFLSGVDGDWENNSPVVPIYNKYGNGDLKTVLLHFDQSEFDPTFATKGFDLLGLPLLTSFGCNFNYCGDPGCLAAAEKAQYGVTVMHMWFMNPNDVTQWATCQTSAFDSSCEVSSPGPCSCCGTVENPSGPRECGFGIFGF